MSCGRMWSKLTNFFTGGRKEEAAAPAQPERLTADQIRAKRAEHLAKKEREASLAAAATSSATAAPASSSSPVAVETKAAPAAAASAASSVNDSAPIVSTVVPRKRKSISEPSSAPSPAKVATSTNATPSSSRTAAATAATARVAASSSSSTVTSTTSSPSVSAPIPIEPINVVAAKAAPVSVATMPNSSPSRRESAVITTPAAAAAAVVTLPPRAVIINPETEATATWLAATDEQRNDARRLWEHALFSELLLVTLVTPDAGRMFLRQLADETTTISRSHMDMLLIERLSMPFELPSTALGYLISSYRRTLDKLTKATNDSNAYRMEKRRVTNAMSGYYPPLGNADEVTYCQTAIQSLLDILISYAAILLMDGPIPDNTRRHSLAELNRLLEADPRLSRSLPANFLPGVIKAIVDRDGATEVFGGVIDMVYGGLTKGAVSANAEFASAIEATLDVAMRKLAALPTLCRYPSIAKLVTEHKSFLPPPMIISARMLENVTLLGPYFGLECTMESGLFQNLSRRPRDEVEGVVSRLQNAWNIHQDQLSSIFQSLVKHDQSREHVLQWVSRALRLNIHRHRTMMRFDPSQVSSTGFFINLAHVLLKLCDPIIARRHTTTAAAVAPSAASSSSSSSAVNAFASFSPLVNGVNPAYFFGQANERIDYTHATRMFAAEKDVAELRRQMMVALEPVGESKDDNKMAAGKLPKFNFGTECFLLTHECLHLGIMHSYRHYFELIREVSGIQQRLIGMGGDQGSLMFQQDSAMVDRLMSESIALRVHILDPILVQRLLAFYNWTCSWLVSLSSPNRHALLSIVPEYILEDIIEFFVFLGRFNRNALTSLDTAQVSGLLEFVVTFMSGANTLKNPHVRGQLPELLMLFTPRDRSSLDARTIDRHVFNTHATLRTSLVPALLDLYVSCETGGRHAHVDKYSTRHTIHEILEFVWLMPQHKQALIQVSSSETFGRFINFVFNDIMLLLEEALKNLRTIRSEQQAMANHELWQQQPAADARNREVEFGRTEQQTQSLMQLANSIVHMLFYITESLTSPFVTAEFVNRTAEIVAYFITKMVGKDIAELKVNDPKRYHFYPRTLLREMVGIFLHVSPSNEFMQCVAANSKSYKLADMWRAARTLRSKAIIGERDVAHFEKLLNDVGALAASSEEEEEALGDVPDEFADALTTSLMRDPVTLPQSGVNVDRSTIKRHLMNKETDPFNNTPLTLDMVKEAPELKAQIEAWIVAQKAKRRDEKKGDRKEDDVAALDDHSSSLSSSTTSGVLSLVGSSDGPAAAAPPALIRAPSDDII